MDTLNLGRESQFPKEFLIKGKSLFIEALRYEIWDKKLLEKLKSQTTIKSIQLVHGTNRVERIEKFEPFLDLDTLLFDIK